MRFEGEEFYLKSGEEMAQLFPEDKFPGAISNTVKIAERCQVEFDFSEQHLPAFDVPEGYDAEGYLRHLADEGFARLYPDKDDSYRERLEYELDMICRMVFTDYFLIVADFVRFARSRDIPVGPGRGSAAGSMVSYCLGITDIDPMRYNLYFERFLNPERVSMPDIDMDFCGVRRQEVIDYVVEKYGEDHVAQIITFGTMAARGGGAGLRPGAEHDLCRSGCGGQAGAPGTENHPGQGLEGLPGTAQLVRKRRAGAHPSGYRPEAGRHSPAMPPPTPPVWSSPKSRCIAMCLWPKTTRVSSLSTS